MNLKYLFIIYIVIVLTVTVYNSNNVKAESLIDIPITKNGITVTLLNNTDICDNKCYSIYNICYDDVNKLTSDLEISFKDVKNDILEPDKYLEKYEIEIGDNVNCRKLTIHGNKGIFEVIDNIPIIKDTEFNEFVVWNSTWSFRKQINFTNEVAIGNDFYVNDTSGLNGDIFQALKVSETMYIYSQNVDFLGELSIGNNSDFTPYENCTSRTGYNVDEVYGDNARLIMHEDEGSSTFAYNSLNNSFKNGTHDMSYVNSLFGLGTDFDETSSDKIDYDDGIDLDMTNNFTISYWLWINAFRGGEHQGILDKRGVDSNQFQFALLDTQKYNFDTLGLSDQSIGSTADAQTGQWTYIVFTYNGTGKTLYIDGEIDTMEYATGSMSVSTQNLWIGSLDDSGTWFFNGSIEEIKIFAEYKNQSWVNEQWYAGNDNLTFEDTIIEEFIEDNTSLLAREFNITEFLISETDFTPVLNISINSTTLTPNVIVMTTNCIGVTGTDNVLFARIKVNGTIIDSEKRICGVKGQSDITSGGFLSEAFLLFVGYNNIEIEFKTSTGSTMNVSNIDFNILRAISIHDNFVQTGNVSISFRANSTSFKNVFNFTATKLQPSPTIISSFYTSNSSTTETIKVYIKNADTNTIFPYIARYLPTSQDVGAFMITLVDNTTYNLTGNINYEIWAESVIGNNVDIIGTLAYSDARDISGKNISSFFTSREDTNLNNAITLNSGYHLLLSKNITVSNGTHFIVGGSVTFNSTSGKHTPLIRVNSSKTAECSIKERTLSSSLNLDIANVGIISICDNMTSGENITWELWIEIESGEGITLLDEMFSGFESTFFPIEIINLSPISNIIINPLNNSLVNGETENITWLDFFEPEGQLVTYNISFLNNDSSFNITINDSTTLLSISINYSEYEIGNYFLMVNGCDIFGLCDNETINITIIPLPPPPFTPIESFTTCFDDDTLQIFTFKLNGTGINTNETQYVYCPHGCIGDIDSFGGRCALPEYQIVIILAIIFIIMFLIIVYLWN